MKFKTSFTKGLILALIYCFSNSFASSAQPYYFTRYSTSDGLTSNTIFRLAQDKEGYIWIGTRNGICRYDGTTFIPGYNELDAYSAMGGMTTGLYVDRDGFVWFSTNRGTGFFSLTNGQITTFDAISIAINYIVEDNDANIWLAGDEIYRYNKKSGQIERYPAESNFRSVCVTVDVFGALWASSTDGKLYKFNSRRDRFEQVGGFSAKYLFATKDGKILVTTPDNKVLLLDPNNESRKEIFSTSQYSRGELVLTLVEREIGEYWIATEYGIFVYKENQGVISHIENSANDIHSISASYVISLLCDNEGNIWAGTFYRGLNLWQNRRGAYNFIYENNSDNSLKGSIVRALFSSDEENLWIGTEDGHLNHYNFKSHVMTEYPTGIENLNIQDIAEHVDGNDLWLCTYNAGLIRYDTANRRIREKYDVGGNVVIRMKALADGTLLVATKQGLYRYSLVTEEFFRIDSLGDKFIHCLLQDSRGFIWVGTYGDGLYILDKKFSVVSHYRRGRDENSLSSDHITAFKEDSKHRIWITTEGGGLSMVEAGYNPHSLSFKRYTVSDGLLSNITCSVSEDRDGMLWIATTSGLTHLNPDTEDFGEAYFRNRQITGNQYSYGASYTLPNGTIYLGTTDGIISFNPSLLKSVKKNNRLFISDIIARAGSKQKSIVNPSNYKTGRYRVNYKDAESISIYFAAPSYSNLLDTKCNYVMKNGLRRTSGTTIANMVRFDNIDYGKNVFEVSIEGSNLPESSKRVIVTVIPPWYASNVAFAFYALLLLSIVSTNFVLYSRRKTQRQEARIKELMNEKQKEIYQSKVNFFTDITHEIRTPLTLIKMPLEKVISNKSYDPSAEKDMLTIQANTDRLITLTNQLLDIRKLEQGNPEIHYTQQDICSHLREICDGFRNVADDQNTSLELILPEESHKMLYSKDGLEKIVGNLISNALKYGKDSIVVSLTLYDDIIRIRVNSNGERIPEENLENIFKKFFHGGKGTGLGLPLARAIAEQHGGRLFVDAEIKDANSFVVEIPNKQLEKENQVIGDAAEETEKKYDFDNSRHTVLIAEDDRDFRAYLAEQLSSEYNVVVAPNGKAALEIVERQKIDIVISDVMMPEMDGCQLCNAIKTNMDTSHIPVILLTAAVGMQTRIETLQVGAEGYIEKPFPIALLMANIANVFKNKEISYHQFANSPLTHYNSVTSNKVDDAFMEKLHSAIMQHISEPDLSIDTLTNILGTSKSTLYRKVKANTDLNINEYVRLCRLKQAAELLSSQQYRINEVAFLVGFSSSSYFATSFQKQFNISPSQFVKNLKNKQ